MPDKILVVDDEVEIADLVELYLKNEDYEAAAAMYEQGLCLEEYVDRSGEGPLE